MLIRKEFIDVLFNAVVSHADIMELRELLVSFNNEGVSKDAMISYLDELRCISNEDVILELMDFVEGYCNPELRIY